MTALAPPARPLQTLPALAPDSARSPRWLNLDPLTILPPLTVLHLLVHAPHAWYLSVALIPLFALGLVFRRWLLTPAFWYVTATLLGTAIYFNWEATDNHKYLFVYWCVALCSALSLPRRQWNETLSRSSRLLIALCMLLATAWKVATPQYLDARFFTYELLVDERFAHFTCWTTGVPLETLAANRELHDLLLNPPAGIAPPAVTLSGAAQVAPLARFLTWWTILIEGLLGVLFLLPAGKWTNRARNGLLILFAITTYSVAPVRGFGWMLMLLGLAQSHADSKTEERLCRWGYLAALLLIQAYTIPLGAIISLISK